jgi:hypothetical protein
MKKLYIVRVEWSQTDQPSYGFWASSRGEAEQRAKAHFPGAYYYGITAIVEKTFE